MVCLCNIVSASARVQTDAMASRSVRSFTVLHCRTDTFPPIHLRYCENCRYYQLTYRLPLPTLTRSVLCGVHPSRTSSDILVLIDTYAPTSVPFHTHLIQHHLTLTSSDIALQTITMDQARLPQEQTQPADDEAAAESQPLLRANNHSSGDESNVITISTEDPQHPMNMPAWRKWSCAAALGAMTFAATFSSSIFNAAIPVTAKEFGVSIETMALATALFVFGFAAGPLIFGPASEVFGRKTPFFLGYLAFILLQIPVALARDATTVLVFRLLSGVASAGSPAIVGGYLADFMAPVDRGIAVAIFAATTLLGPEAGAIIGAVIVQSSLGWRWTAWISLILTAVFSAVGFFLLPETYLPVLQQRRARELRFKTKRWDLHAPKDETPVSLREFAVRYMTRPVVMLSVEPILALMTLYISFVFGLVYLSFVVSCKSFSC